MSDIVKQMVSNALWGGGSSGGSGGGLPTGGAAHQMLVTDAEGKAEWQELLCYETQETVAVMVETEMTFNEDAFYGANPLLTDIVVGDTYTITYNGVDYPCPAYALDGYAFGNLGAMVEGFPTTDDPFILLAFPPEIGDSMGGMYAMLMALDGAETVTISISGITKTVKKLDAKYAPGYGFGDFPYKDRVFLEEITASGNTGQIMFNESLIPGQVYTVTRNGIAYTVAAEKSSLLSNGFMLKVEDGNNSVSIHVPYSNPKAGEFVADKSSTFTLSIVGSGTETIKIPGKYIDKYNDPYVVTAHIKGDSTFTLESVDQTFDEIKYAYEVEKRPVFCMLVNSSSNSYDYMLPLVEKGNSRFIFAQATWPGQHGGIPNLKLTIYREENTLETVKPSFKELITYSPNGTAYKITVSDDGTLTATAL